MVMIRTLPEAAYPCRASIVKDTMSKPTVEKAANFLRPIVQADLDSGKHAKIVTRFPPVSYTHLDVYKRQALP